MASFHTSIDEATTDGEKYLYHLLDKYLDDEFHIWNNLNFGNEIDFFIIHNDLGILLIEVKDWVISQIQNVTNHNVKGKLYGNKITEEPNPIKKSKEIGFNVQNQLQKNDALINKEGKYKNKLKVPINSVTVFTNITTDELKERDFLGDTKFSENNIITKSDLEYSYEEDFLELLYNKRDIKFDSVLRPDEIDFIISKLGTNSGVNDIISHKLEGVLDAHQEKLSNSNLDKNIIIQGPAGSGKTLVLIKRLQNYLLANPKHKVGVFSFNAVLANYLNTYIRQEIKDNLTIDVHYFDSYPNDFNPTYNLILVDEAQDLNRNHCNKMLALLKDEGRMNLFFDKRQTIYTGSDIIEGFTKNGLDKFIEDDLLLQKRSPILQTAVAYYEAIKNPEQPIEKIIEKADKITWRMFFSRKSLKSALNWISRKLNLNISTEETAKAEMKNFSQKAIKQILEPSLEHTLDLISKDIKEKVKNENAEYHNFMILHPLFYDKNEGTDFKKTIKTKLKENLIPFELNHNKFGCEFDGKRLNNLEDNRSSFKFLHNRLRVFELFHCKGLDAEYVYVVDFDKIGEHSRNVGLTVLHNKEAEYVYVCLTRAKKEIKLFSRSNNYSHKKLSEIIEAQK